MTDLSIVAVIALYNGVYSNLDFACVTPAMVFNDPRCGTQRLVLVLIGFGDDVFVIQGGRLLIRQCRTACQLPEHRCADNTPFQMPTPELFCSRPLPTARSAAR
jgi:hypothetical protein